MAIKGIVLEAYAQTKRTDICVACAHTCFSVLTQRAKQPGQREKVNAFWNPNFYKLNVKQAIIAFSFFLQELEMKNVPINEIK